MCKQTIKCKKHDKCDHSLSNIGLFSCLHSLILTPGELGEFKTVMQTLDASQVCITFENSPNSECLAEAM